MKHFKDVKIKTKSSEKQREHLADSDLATARFDLLVGLRFGFVDLRDFRTLSTLVIRVIREAGHPSSLNRFFKDTRGQVISDNYQSTKVKIQLSTFSVVQ